MTREFKLWIRSFDRDGTEIETEWVVDRVIEGVKLELRLHRNDELMKGLSPNSLLKITIEHVK